ncbi:WG repeat-containing protein [Patescibacteria group bacterium]|nr:WG repeat-containing protein [Patescibacteria group bacterium]
MDQITLRELYNRYPIVGNISEGLISVGINGEFFHVSQEDGEPVYKERFDWTEDFHDGLALVEKNGESFHINPNGERID